MEIQERAIVEKHFIFNEADAKKLLFALDYVHHRQSKHNKCNTVPPDWVNYIRQEIRNNL